MKFDTRFLTLIAVLVLAVSLASQVHSTGTATGGYYLDTPLPIASFYVGQYSNGSTYAVNGSNWDNFLVSDNATLVLETCIDASGQGDKIFIGNGTYYCHDLVLKNYTFIEGQSKYGVTLRLNANADVFKSHSDPLGASTWIQRVTLRNLGFYGDRATYTTGGCAVFGVFAYSDFDNLYIKEFHGDGINVTVNSYGYAYENHFSYLDISHCDGYAFRATTVSDSYLENSRLCGDTGSETTCHIAGAVWHITNNYIGHTLSAGAHGLYLASKGSIVTSNQIDWSYEDNIHLVGSWECIISNNRIFVEGTIDATKSWIELETSHDNVIIANHFDGTATKAYCVKENGSPGNTYNNRIIGNIVDFSAVTTAYSLIVGNSSEQNNNWQPYGLISTPVSTTYLKVDGSGSIANDTVYTNSGCPKTIYMQDADTFDVYVNGEFVFDDVNSAMVSLTAGDTFEVEWVSALTILKVFGN